MIPPSLLKINEWFEVNLIVLAVSPWVMYAANINIGISSLIDEGFILLLVNDPKPVGPGGSQFHVIAGKFISKYTYSAITLLWTRYILQLVSVLTLLATSFLCLQKVLNNKLPFYMYFSFFMFTSSFSLYLFTKAISYNHFLQFIVLLSSSFLLYNAYPNKPSQKLFLIFIEFIGIYSILTGSMVETLRPSFFSHRETVVALDYDHLPDNQSVACVKTDVEGAELETLIGMQSLIAHNRSYIICEILDSFNDNVLAFTQDRVGCVCDILFRHDYAIIQLVQSKQTNRIVDFNELDRVKIKQWDPKSLQLNDYIFYPSEKREVLVAILFNLCRGVA